MKINSNIKFLALVLLFGTSSAFSEENSASPEGATNGNPVVESSPLRPERAIFLVESSEGSGSGFLMQEGGQLFFVSNMHVLGSGTNFSIKNVYGETVSVPDTVQVASDRDLIRFPVLDYPGGLPLAKDYGFGDAVCALGNSGGAGVITRLEGTVMAMGPKVIEVSCTFIPGNSGGPVLDKSNRVVCVSTYLTNEKDMPEWIIKGSRFTETRRMAVRVDNVEWMTLSWCDFCREYRYMDRIDDYADEMVSIVNSLGDDKFEMIYSNTDYEGIQEWVKDYNQYVRSSGSRLQKEVNNSKITYSVSPSMKRNLKEKIKGLANLMDSLNGEINMTAVTVPYLKERLEQSADYFDRSRKRMETIVETLL